MWPLAQSVCWVNDDDGGDGGDGGGDGGDGGRKGNYQPAHCFNLSGQKQRFLPGLSQTGPPSPGLHRTISCKEK